MYQVYSISTPDGKYRYYGTSSNVANRIYKHQYRFSGGAGGHYLVYQKLREVVKSVYDCRVKVLKTFNNKLDARFFEQKMIEMDGNLNTANSVRKF